MVDGQRMLNGQGRRWVGQEMMSSGGWVICGMCGDHGH